MKLWWRILKTVSINISWAGFLESNIIDVKESYLFYYMLLKSTTYKLFEGQNIKAMAAGI